MSTITFVLVLMAILFFVGIVGSFLLLLLIGKLTAPKEEGWGEEVGRWGLALPVPVDYGQPPVPPEGPRRDLDTRGGLPAFVLVAVNHSNDPQDRL